MGTEHAVSKRLLLISARGWWLWSETTVGVSWVKREARDVRWPIHILMAKVLRAEAVQYCGACMVGSRECVVKDALVKKLFFFAARKSPVRRCGLEAGAADVHPLVDGQADGARYAVIVRA